VDTKLDKSKRGIRLNRFCALEASERPTDASPIDGVRTAAPSDPVEKAQAAAESSLGVVPRRHLLILDRSIVLVKSSLNQRRRTGEIFAVFPIDFD
jgi:hypothetical protein